MDKQARPEMAVPEVPTMTPSAAHRMPRPRPVGYCNKCGHLGMTGPNGEHDGCNYLAVSTGPPKDRISSSEKNAAAITVLSDGSGPQIARIAFTVLGLPQPGGSKRGFPIRRPNGTIGIAMSDANPKAASWKRAVAEAARQAYTGPLLAGPLSVSMIFYVPRPKGHYGTGRNAGEVRSSAPEYPTVKPDVLKLCRSTEDALTGILWRDDAQTVDLRCRKRYGEPARAVIWVGPPMVPRHLSTNSAVGPDGELMK